MFQLVDGAALLGVTWFSYRKVGAGKKVGNDDIEFRDWGILWIGEFGDSGIGE